MHTAFRPSEQKSYLSRSQTIYPFLEPAGRKIVFGFSYLQRIGMGAKTQVWYPSGFEEQIVERIRRNDRSVLDEFKVEWAAVREFDLLQEGTNAAIAPVDVTDFKYSFKQLNRIRAGGLRIAVITMGRYAHPTYYDELRILDEKLQDAISEFISMIYLEEQSDSATAVVSKMCDEERWTYAEALPHVAITLGAGQAFRPSRSSKAETRFFQLLDMIPSKHIQHDIAVGLRLPEATARNESVYIPASDARFHSLQQALNDAFRAFEGLSLSVLDGRARSRSDVHTTVSQPRGYGDHTRQDRNSYYRGMAEYFRTLKAA